MPMKHLEGPMVPIFGIMVVRRDGAGTVKMTALTLYSNANNPGKRRPWFALLSAIWLGARLLMHLIRHRD